MNNQSQGSTAVNGHLQILAPSLVPFLPYTMRCSVGAALVLGGSLQGLCYGSQVECSSVAFQDILKSIPDSSLNYVAHVAQNGSFGDAATNIPFPRNATGLPELCALSVNIKTPGNTSYNFGMFLPSNWNGRFLATGNGGFGGGINWLDMVSLWLAHRGLPVYASVLIKV